MTKGPKKTFCRKIRNKKYNKTKKTKGGFTVGDAMTMASKSPMGAQLKAEAEKKIQQQKEQAKQKLMAEGQKILNKKIPIDENKLKIILSKLDEKKIKELMDGIEDLMKVIKDMDDETINKIKSGNKEVIMRMIMENPKLRSLLIGELLKNPEMRKLAMEVAMKTPMKGGDLDALLKGYTKNNTNRSFEDIARETKEHEKKAAEYRYNANQLAHESANQYKTMDNEQSRVPFSNGGKNKFLKSA